MGAFYYYLPGQNAAHRDALKDAGLEHLFDGRASATQGGMDPGPGGTRGSVAVIGSPPPVLHVPEGVEWQDCGKFWLGYDPENPPAPGDLEREDLVDGHCVSLADGNAWMIPVARHYDGSTPLPRPIKWHPERGWDTGEVVKRHRDLFAGAQRAWDAMMGATKDESLTAVVELDILAVALGTNYRVGPAEIGALGILTTTNRVDVVRALCDWPGLQALLKKKQAQDNQPSPSGQEE